jgi:hypothetical protein
MAEVMELGQVFVEAEHPAGRALDHLTVARPESGAGARTADDVDLDRGTSPIRLS